MSFEKIYKENYKLVYGYLLKLCKNSSLAEELTAETFYKALEYYENYQHKGYTSTWLCEIAKNLYYKHYNKRKSNINLENENIVDDYDFESKLTDKEMAIQIHKHLHTLKEPYKEVFVLRVFAELSFAEIGTIFSKSEVWARVTFYRGKNMLIKEMEV